MTKEEALKRLAYLGAVWFGNSKQHLAFSAHRRILSSTLFLRDTSTFSPTL